MANIIASSTDRAAWAVAATMAFVAPPQTGTIISLGGALDLPMMVRSGVGITRTKLAAFELIDTGSKTVGTSSVSGLGTPEAGNADRPTTAAEEAIGEIRSWTLLHANWDGEGARAPVGASLREAVAFVRLLENLPVPEPMLFGSGRAGLYWNDGDTYADLEFTGDSRVTYYIERRGGGKHKGVVLFDSEHMPAVFPALLSA
jgi:hypothetical protein